MEILLPWDILDCGCGFAIDIGGSALKLAYVEKEEWLNPKRRQQSTKGLVKLKTFDRHNIDPAFKFMEEHVLINAAHDTVVYTTGIGCLQLKSRILQQLNIKKLENISETDCFVHTLIYLLKNLPREDVVEEPHLPAYKHIKAERKTWQTMLAHLADKTTATFRHKVTTEEFEFAQQSDDFSKAGAVPFAEADLNVFPCGLVFCGSASCLILVNEDDTFEFVDGNPLCGRTFVGLGNLLTGCKDYDELLNLSAKGNGQEVDICMTHLTSKIQKPTDDGDDAYSVFATHDDHPQEYDNVSFSMGEACNKDIDEFRKEDIARSLLRTMLMSLISYVFMSAQSRNLSHVFFSGNYVSHPLVREIITIEWLRMMYKLELMSSKPVTMTQIHFLKHGSHLGALGALLNHKDLFSEKTNKTIEMV